MKPPPLEKAAGVSAFFTPGHARTLEALGARLLNRRNSGAALALGILVAVVGVVPRNGTPNADVLGRSAELALSGDGQRWATVHGIRSPERGCQDHLEVGGFGIIAPFLYPGSADSSAVPCPAAGTEIMTRGKFGGSQSGCSLW
jgi:hypothetical protein